MATDEQITSLDSYVGEVVHQSALCEHKFESILNAELPELSDFFWGCPGNLLVDSSLLNDSE
jgi:hypothetical protein